MQPLQKKPKKIGKILQPLHKKKILQLLQNCIGSTILIGQEIQSLPYAGFLIRNKSGVWQKFAEQIEMLDIHLLYETLFLTSMDFGRS